MADDNLPATSGIIRAGAMSAVIMIVVSAIQAYGSGFSWLNTLILILLWFSSMWFLVNRTKKMRKDNVQLNKPETIRQGIKNTLQLAGDFKVLFKLAGSFTVIAVIIIFIKVWSENQI